MFADSCSQMIGGRNKNLNGGSNVMFITIHCGLVVELSPSWLFPLARYWLV
jgi:hypothetical protein